VSTGTQIVAGYGANEKAGPVCAGSRIENLASVNESSIEDVVGTDFVLRRAVKRYGM
jgi:hypothetical protein